MNSSRMLFAALISLVVFASKSFGQDESVALKMTEDLVYGHKDGLALTMDVIRPEQNRNGLAVILVSSGSWISRKSDVPDPNPRRLERFQELTKGGYTIFVVRHGSAPRYVVTEMIPDMNRAVRYVRSVAPQYEINPHKIGITGFSSGGHLSLMAGMTGDNGKPDSHDPVERYSSKVQCVMAWFPPTDFLNWGSANTYQQADTTRAGLFKKLIGEPQNLESQLKSISPTFLATKDSPPLLMIHGDSDKTVPLQQSELLKTKYEEVGATVKLIVQPGGEHKAWPGMDQHFVLVREWFDQHLGGGAAESR